MDMIIVSVYDRASECFNAPQYAPTPAAAIRGFAMQVNDPENKMLNEHPEDYDLYKLGTYNQRTGAIDVGEGPSIIARAQDLVEKDSSTA